MYLLLSLYLFPLFAREDMMQRTLQLIERDYLWDYEPTQGIISAAERLEDIIPWLIVESQADEVILSHGKDGVLAVIPISEGVDIDVYAELTQLQEAIAELPYPLPENIEIDVELLKGYMNHLDRYSTVMYKESLRKFTERIQGKLTGIGARLIQGDEGILVLEIFPNSPAEKGGIKVDDVITHIDDASLKNVPFSQAIDRLRGSVGSKVKLHISRGKNNFTQVLKRAKVRIPNVRFEIRRNIIHIEIENFSSQTMRGLQRARAAIRAHGQVKGIVLDLRNNSGGSMLQSCRVVDFFIGDGVVLTTRGRDNQSIPLLMKLYEAEEDSDDLSLPMVVLVNKRSASASEIVAGSLKLHNRAVLIGQRTHGKGVVQMPHTVRSSPKKVKIKLTVAQYLLKDEFSVHEQKGVEPDLWLTRYQYNKDGFEQNSIKPSELDIPVLKYTREQEGWRQDSKIRKDYPLALARKILRASKGVQTDDVRKTMLDMLEKEQKKENRLMSELFEARNISWQFKPSGDLEGLNITMGPHSLNAGAAYRIPIVMYNSLSKPINQVMLRTEGRTASAPWDEQWLAVGDFAPRERKVVFLEDTVPIRSGSKIESLGGTLYAQSQKRELPKYDVFLNSLSAPHFQVELQYEPTSKKGEGAVRVWVHNKTGRDVKNIRVRFSLPNTKEVEFLSESSKKIKSLEAAGSLEEVFYFSHKIPVAKLDDIKIEIKSERRPNKFLYEERLSNLVEKQYLEMPHIKASLPLQLKKGRHDLNLTITDDGALSQSTVWLNGEKIAWTEEPSVWTVPVQIDTGHNKLVVEAVDNHGLRQKHYIYVEGIE